MDNPAPPAMTPHFQIPPTLPRRQPSAQAGARISRFASVGAALCLLAPLAEAADPVVSNISAVQRAGTQLVDITYDVTADTSTVQVTLAISSDGGTTFNVPATTVSGAVGTGVAIGTGKAITWNAGADWAKQYSTTTRFKVTADDLLTGFSLIPAGSFQMGNAMAADTDITNAPIRSVTVSAFYMAQNLVTKEEWDTVRVWGLTHGYTDLAVGAGKAVNHPVQTITWYDMVKWCNAHSEKDGLTPCYTVSGVTYRTGSSDVADCNWAANGYRLPSEAEWEKAARGGLSGKRFPWGDTITHSQANYTSTTGYAYDVSPTRGYHPVWGTGSPPYTSPVESFAPNGYGLYDMAGNLYEWCWDWYGAYAAGSQTDPRGVASGSFRVVRGGGWDSIARYCRVAFRVNGGPSSSYGSVGFRTARSSVP
jgi:formylglycine-generating enzyme required for sulfatase activity